VPSFEALEADFAVEQPESTRDSSFKFKVESRGCAVA
jgi:hypothetical protein